MQFQLTTSEPSLPRYKMNSILRLAAQHLLLEIAFGRQAPSELSEFQTQL